MLQQVCAEISCDITTKLASYFTKSLRKIADVPCPCPGARDLIFRLLIISLETIVWVTPNLKMKMVFISYSSQWHNILYRSNTRNAMIE